MQRVLCAVARAVAASGQSGQLASKAYRAVAQPKAASTYTGIYKGVAALAGFSPLLPGLAPSALASEPRERTFIAIKPDGVHRGLIAEIVQRFESRGYKLVAIKLVVPTTDLAGSHYAEHEGKPFYPKLVNFLTSGPVLAMVWEGKDVIKSARSMIGATNPSASAPGTIRGDLCVDVGRNCIHGSDSVESAKREIGLWFKPDELVAWEPVASKWIYE